MRKDALMKKTASAVFAVAACAAFAEPSGDRPDDTHAWAVHDMNRPNPVKVEPGREVGQPPSDAIVLFDGTRESFEKNWPGASENHRKNSQPCFPKCM